MKTGNPKSLEAAEELAQAVLHLGRAELALQRADDQRHGYHVIVANNLATQTRNLATDILYGEPGVSP